MAIKKDVLANALKIRGSQSLGDSIYKRLKSVSADNKIKNINSEEKNGSQTVHKRFTEKDTNGSQTVHKRLTNGLQENKTVDKRFTEKDTNGSQTVHKRLTEKDTNGSQIIGPKNISHLTGIQRKLILAIYLNCKTFGGETSQEMTIDHLSNLSKCNKKSIKTTIYRLKEKGFIEMVEQKNGRGGWTKYKINNNIYSDILQQEMQIFNSYNDFEIEKRFTNSSQTVHNRNTEPNTQPYTTHSSSSSLNINTTTTKNTTKSEMSEDWLTIDIEPLEFIRFHKGHVEQLFKHGLELGIVQKSIYHFSFDLLENKKLEEIKSDPLNFFMGIMKRSGAYVAPENYESPRDRAKREFLEKETKKATQLLEAEKALLKQYFLIWSQKLSQQQKIDLVGKDEYANHQLITQNDKLLNYYKEKFWIEQYQKIQEGK